MITLEMWVAWCMLAPQRKAARERIVLTLDQTPVRKLNPTVLKAIRA